jgi:hypothetical protein
MATGAVFNLLASDGRQDRILMANEFLKQRLGEIQKARMLNQAEDPLPTLLDVERTHVLFVNAHFKPFVAIAFEYYTHNATSGAVALGTDVMFNLGQYGDFIADMVLQLELGAPTLTNNGGASTSASFQYYDLPGVRVLQNTKLEINGSKLDEYSSDSVLMHDKFLVQPHKRNGWLRCMGNQVSREGVYAEDTSTIVPDTQVLARITDGPQTPRDIDSIIANPSTFKLAMFIPVLLWCRDPRLALPSLAIPSGQRNLTFTLAPTSSIIHGQVRGATGQDKNFTFTDSPIITCKLWVNNLFVNPDIHDIFMRRVGFTMIRVHREFHATTTKNQESLQLLQLKWPTECLFVGVRPTAQKNHPTRWHKFNWCETGLAAVPKSLTTESKVKVATPYVADTTAPFAGQNPSLQVEYDKELPMVDKFSVNLHGIPIYKDMPSQMFNSYMTYQYGVQTINSPTDSGVYMIPFCLYPGTYQPSGYVNASRAREFFLEFTSSIIGTSKPNTSDVTRPRVDRLVGTAQSVTVSAEVVVVSSAINFLLITDGSCVLRYST